MTSAVFSFPTTTVFGPGSLSELAGRLESIGAKRPLIVTDPGFRATESFDLARRACPHDAAVFDGVHANPAEDDVEAAATAYAANGCDSVIGLGGGSALDVAKVIRLRIRFPRWTARDAISSDPIEDLAPFIAIPTTAGTGSEVGRSSVITVGRAKCVIFHPSLLARIVVLDPRLTVGLPAKITAATGADALTHCIESFTSPAFHPLCDGIALEGIRLIAQALPRAVREPDDLDARGKMQVAAMMGGIAFQKDLGAAHSLAHPLSAMCGLHHGLANALVLPAVMRFNVRRKPDAYHRVGLAMGRLDALAGVTSLLGEIGITPSLRAQGVRDDQLDALADAAFADSCHRTNPVPVTRDDLRRLYEESM